MPDVMKTVGRYEILRELGRGGMALVYLARQTDLDRFVALKELGAFHASDASFAQRFLRESRVAGSLSHPNIVTVHDYFEHDGTPYIAMEYVERGSLRPYVGKMTLAQIGGVLEGLLAGLTNAEQNGIVHRDLKPENLMVTSDGRVKIADFGIAKATTKMQTGAFLTATGTTVGTPTYMAPEQAMAQDIGPWTDLYSVGCMAFEMFTGKVPFHDSDAPMAILLRHVNEPIAPVKSIDPHDRPGHLGLDREDARQGPDAAHAVGGRRVGRLRGDHHRPARAALAPRRAAGRARRRARTRRTRSRPRRSRARPPGASASDEFQSFAWGQPAGDTGGAAPSPGPYTPPPQDLPPGPMERVARRPRRRPRRPLRSRRPPRRPPRPPSPSRPRPRLSPSPSRASDEPIDSGFVTFGSAGAGAADRRAGAAAGRGAAADRHAPPPSRCRSRPPRRPRPSRNPSRSRSCRRRPPRSRPRWTRASRPSSPRRRPPALRGPGHRRAEAPARGARAARAGARDIARAGAGTGARARVHRARGRPGARA